jgi:hypothetical protein
MRPGGTAHKCRSGAATIKAGKFVHAELARLHNKIMLPTCTVVLKNRTQMHETLEGSPLLIITHSCISAEQLKATQSDQRNSKRNQDRTAN